MSQDTPEGVLPKENSLGSTPHPAISIQAISKSFGSVHANRDISFDVQPASIHAIVGQNGAGKSTLMKILYGIEQPDSGTISVRGQSVDIRSPRVALGLGIGLLQQELALLDELTLLENLMLGSEITHRGVIDQKAELDVARSLQEAFGVHVDWTAKAGDVPIGQKQMVEIMRQVHLGADVLILDEPTAALAPAMVKALLQLMVSLRDQGKTLIFISHKVTEVLAVSDEVTVLRDGACITSQSTAGLDAQSLARLIVGGETTAVTDRVSLASDTVVLQAAALSVADKSGRVRVREASFQLHEHEILGVCGVTGNGQDELLRGIVGLLPSRGQLQLAGQPVERLSVKARANVGLAYVSPDRRREGLAITSSVSDNAIGGHTGALSTFGWLRRRSVRAFVGQLIERFAVKAGRSTAPASSLSGGNQQKLVVGREIMQQPRVLVASQPTRGVDLNGVNAIRSFLVEARNGGAAVLLSSEDLDELLEMSDRIIVMYSGTVVAEAKPPYDVEAIGRSMLGITS